MARNRTPSGNPPDSVMSIIGTGMRVVGSCETDGSIRIEGRVEGKVRAGKAVAIGKDGRVEGDIFAPDAVISGTVHGMIVAESRLEFQATARVDGDIHARRMRLEEGALLNGQVKIGEIQVRGLEGEKAVHAARRPQSAGESRRPMAKGSGKVAAAPSKGPASARG